MIINRFVKNSPFDPMKPPKSHLFFTKNLLIWNRSSNHRSMPWKFERDPYKIWLSEIILQQTRVEQGTGYYNKFVKKYPSIRHLAKAPEAEVFKLWEGLGYYSRCRNLLATAQHISQAFNGQFPDQYADILKLKGIGPYTAAAIASFAYNLPHAVVDGNVMRVLARYLGVQTPIDSTAGKKEFAALANQLLKKDEAAQYNQAIMDFGATVCKPQSPHCGQCMLKAQCHAYNQGAVDQFPVKGKRLAKKNRHFFYLIASYKGQYYVRQRLTKDIWRQLYEFILCEVPTSISPEVFIRSAAYKKGVGQKGKLVHVSALQKQALTHQTIAGYFLHVQLTAPLQSADYIKMNLRQLSQLAFPKFITQYLQSNKDLF